MRLAVVDDETIVQKRLQTALAKEGHQVSTFGTGEEFLKDQAATPFDLVFLDVILPGINGMETLKRIKAQAPDTEVILMTGRASLDAAIEAVKLGAFHYFAKPFRLEEVRGIWRPGLADLPLDLREFSVTPYREWNTLEEQEREYIAKILA